MTALDAEQGAGTVVAMHAESVPGDEFAMRWVMADGRLASGRLLDAPGVLGGLLRRRVIVRAVVEPGVLWTWLGEPRWPERGPIVRDAIADAARVPAQWRIEPADDEVLTLVSRDVVERALGPWIASHGGHITLTDAARDVVNVKLEGTCVHCPAAGLTIHGRIQTVIGQRMGHPVTVNATGLDGGLAGRVVRWPRLLRR